MFRKKPVVIEARQLMHDSYDEVIDWCGGKIHQRGIVIETLEGDHLALMGDYIIKGVAGEFYPCKPDIFEATYEAVDP
jgi:hypothetical protein